MTQLVSEREGLLSELALSELLIEELKVAVIAAVRELDAALADRQQIERKLRALR